MNLEAELSKREMEVAEVLAFTGSKKQAADKLCIAGGTLSRHSYTIYEKLGIHSRAELVIWWFLKNFSIPAEKIPQFCIAVFINASLIMPSEKMAVQRYRTDRQIFIRTTKNYTI
ncbi:response regulator transcription factor [Cruoricaptor ignavus]|uniref:response regulator transcription factor n=1 Tax=Cruoricaptor ignavus TaxID=1118202 RepID=UPI00370D27B0